jgi:hypothetical protein
MSPINAEHRTQETIETLMSGAGNQGVYTKGNITG